MKLQILQSIFLCVLFFTIHNSTIPAQTKRIKNGIELNTPAINLRVQFYSDNVMDSERQPGKIKFICY